tara:strand:- start:128 stop:337 length:210 start_codon:yes stop_codon:yes gene_type:complete
MNHKIKPGELYRSLSKYSIMIEYQNKIVMIMKTKDFAVTYKYLHDNKIALRAQRDFKHSFKKIESSSND